MGVYQLGAAVVVTQTFTIADVPTDPTTVTYTLEDPEGTITTYVFGVAPEVTNPGVGIYLLTVTPSKPGEYHYKIVGTGAVVASGSGDFTVLNSQVAPQDLAYPEFGPYTLWADYDDVTSCCSVEDPDANLVNAMLLAASQVLFEASGRLFAGRKERTVRPCSLASNCWTWASQAFSGTSWLWTFDGYAWGWYDAVGRHCGCSALSKVKLPGYPVQEIIEVKIDGAVVAPDGYRLDDRRFLVRVRTSATEAPVMWPSCQQLDLPDTEDGTFSVTYVAGMDPPQIGKMAAAALACEFLSSCSGGECKLPSGVTRIVRQGVTVERVSALAEMLRKGSTGIPTIDAFIAAYNPNGLQRRPVVYSPDGQQFARQVGQ